MCIILQTLNDDINSQKSKARDIISAGKRLRRESSTEDDAIIKDRLDEVKRCADATSKLSADRLSVLEQAMPLAEHFKDTYADLLDWFADIEPQVDELDSPAFNTEQIKEQQDHVKVSHQTLS